MEMRNFQLRKQVRRAKTFTASELCSSSNLIYGKRVQVLSETENRKGIQKEKQTKWKLIKYPHTASEYLYTQRQQQGHKKNFKEHNVPNISS
jgi:hypothetical protein